MAGMIGMAQTLAVYHYGYHTLPTQIAAVLDWGLDTPQGTQSKIPPQMKNETPRMMRPMRKRRRQKSRGVRLSRTRQMTRPKTRSLEPPTSWKP